jgi:hypothetical protein
MGRDWLHLNPPVSSGSRAGLVLSGSVSIEVTVSDGTSLLCVA